MYYPSLTFLICAFSPLLGLAWAKQGRSALRIYLMLAALLFAAAVQALLLQSALGSASKSHWVLNSTLRLGDTDSNNVISIALDPAIPLSIAALLSLCALLVWLQTRNAMLYYPSFTAWLAAPMALLAAAVEPVIIALPYISGLLKWSFAAPAVKTAGSVGILGLSISGLALLGFFAQFGLSLLKRLRS